MSAVVLSPISVTLHHASGEECSSNEPDTNALICKNNGHEADEDGIKDNVPYTTILKSMLTLKREIVLDFTCLKSCLDPQKEKRDGEDFDYEEFLTQQLEKGEIFSLLEVLKVRNLKIPLPLTPQMEDYYANLLYGTLQLSNLVELDLNGLTLPMELQQHLTFWNLHNLKRLYLDSMGLTTFPASVGRLRQLEVLSVKNNQLNDLPITLAFCKKLKDLNLGNNKFAFLPDVLLRLPNLQELRRLDNPLHQLYHGFEHPPHINISTPSNSVPCSQQTKQTFNPDSLQTLSTKAAYTHHIDYWTNGTVGVLQCRILDHLASQFTVCEHCNSAMSKTGKGNRNVDVMFLRYLDLRFVPVRFTTCSEKCQAAVLQHYRELQTQTQADLDREYETTMKEAHTQAKRSDVDISAATLSVPEHHIQYFVGHQHVPPRPHIHVQRRKRKCTIM